jgi:hypothetical protein
LRAQFERSERRAGRVNGLGMHRDEARAPLPDEFGLLRLQGGREQPPHRNFRWRTTPTSASPARRA